MIEKKLRCFLLFLIMGYECWAEETWKGELIHTEYVHPIDDDTTIPLPFVKLRGKIIQHTFPGVPNYESIEDGDAPETRWVLVIPETEIQDLRRSRYIPQEDIFGSRQRGWVQLISPGAEEDPSLFINEPVVVEGYLGTLIFHIHTPITIEATNIYDEAQKTD